MPFGGVRDQQWVISGYRTCRVRAVRSVRGQRQRTASGQSVRGQRQRTASEDSVRGLRQRIVSEGVGSAARLRAAIATPRKRLVQGLVIAQLGLTPHKRGEVASVVVVDDAPSLSGGMVGCEGLDQGWWRWWWWVGMARTTKDQPPPFISYINFFFPTPSTKITTHPPN